MLKKSIIEERTFSTISAFMRRYEIRSIILEKGLGITNTIEISDIDMHLINEKTNPDQDYSVEFKLQSECADISQYLKAIQTEPEFSIVLTPNAETLTAKLLNTKLHTFLEIIRDRIKSALKEQTVQNIRYVGNTFILNNSTRFKVLSDEGDGRLNIEVLTKDKPLDALLTASGLLDGLYLGSIKQVNS